MLFGKIFGRVFAVLILAASLLISQTVSAEIQIYIGVGEYAMSADETMEFAKNQAKLQAERDAAEKFSVYVESQSEVANNEITRDEIVVLTESVMRVLDVKYNLVPIEEDFLIRANVTAEFDTEEIKELLANTGKSR